MNQRSRIERRISFIVSPSWGARTIHWSFPVWGARMCIGCIVVLLLALVLAAGHYARVLTDAQDVDALRQENAALREHYQKLLSLESELANLAEELTQLRWIAGLEVYEDTSSPECDQESGDELPH